MGNHINTVSTTMRVIASALGYKPNDEDYNKLWTNFEDIFINKISEKQHRYIRALANNYKIAELKEQLTTWKELYEQN